MFNQYPYINLNDLNLDYILKAIKEMRYEVTNFVSINAIKYADPIQWNITSQYEKNTIVIDPLTGTAYISVAPVPAGVALTRPEYWTVVFDLGAFVTRAAKNFTVNYEEETTLTATFSTTAGEWIIWGDTLYVAKVNITAGDSYVVGGNIEHITVEEVKNNLITIIDGYYDTITGIIGELANLTTTDKDSIVDAINSIITERGALSDLTTSDTDSIVDAINSIITERGALSDLTTSDTDSIVDAINSIITERGALSDLSTTDTSSIVNSINSLKDEIDTFDLSGRFEEQNGGSIYAILNSDTVVNTVYETLYPSAVFSKYGIGFTTPAVSEASLNAPETALAIGLEHINATSDGVGLWIASKASVDNAAVFGANIIVTADNNSKMVGLEIDYEPADGVTPTDGNSLILNVFNSACPGSHIMIGGVSNGSMANGIIIGNGVRQACVASTYNTNSQWFINSENGSFSDIAIQLGESLSKGIGLRTSASERAFIYTRGTDFLVRNNAGNLLLGAGASEQSFIVFSNGLIGTRTATVTTSATAGSATLPSNPVGFLSMDINGTIRKIPFYE